MGDDTALAEWVQSTSIYKRYAKGITAAVAALINMAWLLTVLPANLVPTNVAVIVALAVQFIGGVVGVAAIPNSPTISQAQAIEDYVGRHRRA
jgi:hypothetical protein